MKRFLAILLISLMILSVSCNNSGANTPQESESVSESEGQTTPQGSSEAGDENLEETTQESPENGGELPGIIENAYELSNGVTAYFESNKHNSFIFENQEMILSYGKSNEKPQLVESLTSKSGNTYLENTMDVFVRMTDGKTYYSSESLTNATANIYRMGYYFYEMRMEEQDFIGSYEVIGAKKINYTNPSFTHQVNWRREGNELIVTNAPNANDPHIEIFKNGNYSTADYTFLQVSIKADALVSPGVQMYYIAGDGINFTDGQMLNFSIKTDGEYHTYIIPLGSAADYSGHLKGIRFDINGGGGTYSINDFQLLKVDAGAAPKSISMNRSFMVYSDKMHHVIQIAAIERTENIAAVGMLTEIPANKVTKIVLEDKNGIRYTLDGADWDSVQYIGFDIADAGVFGYILPYDGKGGRIEVTLSDGTYKIEQTMCPDGGVIEPSEKNTGNANDFYMGQRIYTDENHDFSEFLLEAYFERNPLKDNLIKVSSDDSSTAEYAGYDSLRGIYKFTLAGPSSFGVSYSGEPNRHYNVKFTLRGDDKDRMIYVLTHTKSGTLECAALLDSNGMMLPVPLEVGKNFSEEVGDRNLFNIDDIPYGEVIFPMPVKANEKYEYNVLNLYQNWGNYPLKQISWIQFSTPFYHLSTGVTETNCIIPYYFTKEPGSCNTLPDHRSMSAPFWKNQPQHNSCGAHQFLMYTDADGNYYYSENIKETIDSYGPTYADVKMDYVTTDGKISMSYTHTEMPQTDENRGYYEMVYTVNEDVSFKDFANDFQFYSVHPNDPSGIYQRVGYLNDKNECSVAPANKTNDPIRYVLGSNCPYFSFFDMDNYTSTAQEGYSNVSFLIYDSEFIIGGVKTDASFLLLDTGGKLVLSLDLGEVTLKAGDSFKINAIIMPWGSQELEGVYDTVINETTGEKYQDKNVRDVRENTLLNPLKLTAGNNCQAIESVFVPKAATTDGKSAEFTLSGGENNVAVRIYGFEKLTAPKIYEKIGDEWVEYAVSSAKSPDISGYYHYYDGYCVYYDGDGTYSYSFVTTMNGGESRTFRIVADADFTRWPVEEKVEISNEDKLNIYLDYEELGKNLGGSLIGEGYIGNYEISNEGYVRIFGMGSKSSKTEGYLFALSPGSEPAIAGKYIVLKYRIPTENKEGMNTLQFYLSTSLSNPAEEGLFLYDSSGSDGEWQVLVIDVTKNPREEFGKVFVPNADGEYVINFLRFDFFDTVMSEESYFDFAYLGMDNDLDKIIEINSDFEYLTYVEGNTKYKLSTATGEIVDLNGNTPDVGGGEKDGYIAEGSGYSASDKAYWSCLDMINGRGENGAALITQPSGSSKNGGAVFEHNGSTVGDSMMIFSGWCVVNGGVSKYVWSVDGGVTWHDAAFNIYSSLPNADTAIMNSATNHLGIAFDAGSERNAVFQGGLNNPDPASVAGIYADLSDYSGETVSLTLAAVPQNAQDTLCVIAHVTGITVP